MTKYREILRLTALGLSLRNIQRSLYERRIPCPGAGRRKQEYKIVCFCEQAE